MAGHTLSPVDSTPHSSSLPQSAHFLDQSLHHMPGLSSGSIHFLEFSALLVSVKLSFLSLVLNLPFADVSVLLADALWSSPAWGEVLQCGPRSGMPARPQRPPVQIQTANGVCPCAFSCKRRTCGFQ